jgi:hypothetical protein
MKSKGIEYTADLKVAGIESRGKADRNRLLVYMTITESRWFDPAVQVLVLWMKFRGLKT